MADESKVRQSIRKHRDAILRGTMLAIDPSIGSTSSSCGYAIYVSGKLVESGLIEVNKSASQTVRLYELARTFREDFTNPDIVAIEGISPVPYAAKRGFSKVPMTAISLSALHRAVGAILGAQKWTDVIEIPPITWKKYKSADYKKDDHIDAQEIGRAVILIAREMESES